MRKVFVLVLMAAALCAAAASATTVMYVPVGRSVQMSELVLVGHVLNTKAAFNAEGEIVTEVSLLVEEPLKGWVRPGEIFTFHAWGGSLDGTTVETVGEARYKMGEKVLVQLEDINGGGEFHTLGLSFGKWNVVRDDAGSPWIIRKLDDLNVVGLTETPATRLPLDRMRRIVREQGGRLSF
jgi:hypothetical protein